MIVVVVIEPNFPGQLCLRKLSILLVCSAASDRDLVTGRVPEADSWSRDDRFRSVVIRDDELHDGTRDHVNIIANNGPKLCATVDRKHRVDL